LDLDIFRS